MSDACFVLGLAAIILVWDLTMAYKRKKSGDNKQKRIDGLPVVRIKDGWQMREARVPHENNLGMQVSLSTVEVRMDGHRYQVMRFGKGRRENLDIAFDVTTGDVVMLDGRESSDADP